MANDNGKKGTEKSLVDNIVGMKIFAPKKKGNTKDGKESFDFGDLSAIASEDEGHVIEARNFPHIDGYDASMEGMENDTPILSTFVSSHPATEAPVGVSLLVAAAPGEYDPLLDNTLPTPVYVPDILENPKKVEAPPVVEPAAPRIIHIPAATERLTDISEQRSTSTLKIKKSPTLHWHIEATATPRVDEKVATARPMRTSVALPDATASTVIVDSTEETPAIKAVTYENTLKNLTELEVSAVAPEIAIVIEPIKQDFSKETIAEAEIPIDHKKDEAQDTLLLEARPPLVSPIETAGPLENALVAVEAEIKATASQESPVLKDTSASSLEEEKVMAAPPLVINSSFPENSKKADITIKPKPSEAPAILPAPPTIKHATVEALALFEAIPQPQGRRQSSASDNISHLIEEESAADASPIDLRLEAGSENSGPTYYDKWMAFWAKTNERLSLIKDYVLGNSNESSAELAAHRWKRGRKLVRDAWDKTTNLLQYSDEETVEMMRATRIFFYYLAGFCVLSVFWMTVTKLDVVSTTKGEITPGSSIKNLQHLEGGIIKEVLVKEGAHVKLGELLVRLDSVNTGSSVMEMGLRLASLRADVARLEAESLSTEESQVQPNYPESLKKDYPGVYKQSLDFFNARQNKLFYDLRGYQERITQRQQDLAEITARQNNLKDRYNIVQEQLKISEGLLRDNLTNRYNHLELLRDVNTIKSNIQEGEAGLKRAEAQVDEMRAVLEAAHRAYLEDVTSKLEDAKSQFAEASERMVKLRDSLARTNIFSPVDGIIKQIYISTNGGIVKPGETILDIVPAGEKMMVEAQLPVQDIGYIQAGQSATIRLASSDAMRFNKLNGKVVYIAADTNRDDKTNQYFYKVHIEPVADHFTGQEGVTYQLYPGMQVTANIVTGRRSTLQYVLSPFLANSYSSLQER